MDDSLNTAQVARTRIFVMLDGAFVVKWSDNRVQELLTGVYRNFERRDFGAAITDFELNQLKQAGIVAMYDKEYVWLSLSGEHQQALGMQARVRSYYLHTTLATHHREAVEQALGQLGLADELHARLRDDFVVILGMQGRSFRTFDEAEQMRLLLADQLPELFEETVVAFIETSRRD
jgi:hypothetical protein